MDTPQEIVSPATAPVQPATEPIPTPATPETPPEAPLAPETPVAQPMEPIDPAPPEASPPAPDPAPETPIATEETRFKPFGVGIDGSVYRPRSDDDVLTNHFCRVIAGEYTGRYGVLQSTATLGVDGWPDLVVVRTRDAEDENIIVPYAAIRPDEAGKR
jgi:hypothetical protein